MKQIYYGILFALLVYLKLNENKTKKGNFRIAALVGIIYILYQLFQGPNIEGIMVPEEQLKCPTSPSNPVPDCPKISHSNFSDEMSIYTKWCPKVQDGVTVPEKCYIFDGSQEVYDCSAQSGSIGVENWIYPSPNCQCSPSCHIPDPNYPQIQDCKPYKITRNWLTDIFSPEKPYVCHDRNLFKPLIDGEYYLPFVPLILFIFFIFVSRGVDEEGGVHGRWLWRKGVGWRWIWVRIAIVYVYALFFFGFYYQMISDLDNPHTDTDKSKQINEDFILHVMVLSVFLVGLLSASFWWPWSQKKKRLEREADDAREFAGYSSARPTSGEGRKGSKGLLSRREKEGSTVPTEGKEFEGLGLGEAQLDAAYEKKGENKRSWRQRST